MEILIYGDSNTFGQAPNLAGYTKNAKIERYQPNEIWWYPLTVKNHVVVNGLPGRAINNDNPWLPGRNATATIVADLQGLNPDLTIIQLGTNDCKSSYHLTAVQITNNLQNLIQTITAQIPGTRVMVLSPAIIKEGNPITDKYYVGAELKSAALDTLYQQLCQANQYLFVSGAGAQVGEDGEHLTKLGHRQLQEKVMQTLSHTHTHEPELTISN